jgi:4a-hydroxytetrahydrobiopterin dehydratase
VAIGDYQWLQFQEAAMKLILQKTKPITKSTSPLSRQDVVLLLREIPGWSLGEHTIGREFLFKDFRTAMDFVNSVALIANKQDHHPDIFISYNKVQLTLSTHKIGGLTLNDFIVAAKIDALTNQPRIRKVA